MRTENKMPASTTTQATRTGPPAKRATKLSLSTDVLESARSLGINISQVCDQHLRGMVPLRSLKHFAAVKLPTRLTPVLTVQGEARLLEPPNMAAVPLRALTAPVASLADRQAEITAALDFLLQGY